MRNSRHIIRLTVGLAFALSAAGCGSDATTAASVSVAGTWTLKSINGTLPFVIQSGTGSTSITGSVLTLSANGTYNEVLSYKLTQGTTTTTGTATELGTYEAVNGSITFHDQTDGTTYNGSVTGNTLTEIVNGYTQVYAR